MSVTRSFTCRGVRSKRWAIATLVALLASPVGGPLFMPTATAQTVAPWRQGFVITAGDLRFIFDQILVAQDHAAGLPLLGPGPNQVHDPQFPVGLRTVDGTFNNLVPNQIDANGVPAQFFGAADQLFPRRTTAVFRTAEQGTSYTQLSGNVFDSQPRTISNLIVDQTAKNPAAVAANFNPCGSGGFVCGGGGTADPVTGSLFIPNITPDFGLSAPFNLMFTFFGQFFDHGLDLVNKGGNGSVIMPLQSDDPLRKDAAGNTIDVPPMTMPRASVDANHNSVNQTTPWVDQNQTFTSHPSHQVFLRQYQLVGGRPVQDGKMLDSDGFCSARGTGFGGVTNAGFSLVDNICNIGNWGEVKRQASTKLGINLTDAVDLLDVPLLLTDRYGHFKPGPARGFPQVVCPGNVVVEGDPAANGGRGISTVGSLRTNHQFLNDIAHSAVPTAAGPDLDTVAGTSLDTPQPAGTYDNELLDLHFV